MEGVEFMAEVRNWILAMLQLKKPFKNPPSHSRKRFMGLCKYS